MSSSLLAHLQFNTRGMSLTPLAHIYAVGCDGAIKKHEEMGRQLFILLITH